MAQAVVAGLSRRRSRFVPVPVRVKFVVDRVTGEGFYSNTSLSPFSIIPKILHAHLNVNTSFIRRTSGRNFGTLKQINAFSDIGECEIEEYEYLHIIL